MDDTPLMGDIVPGANVSDESAATTDFSRPERYSLDIYRTLFNDLKSHRLGTEDDIDELKALSKWVKSCDMRANLHIKKARRFKWINQVLSFSAAVASGLAGVVSAMIETDTIRQDLGILVSVLSFAAAIFTVTDNSILDAPGKYREHKSADAGYGYLAGNIAVSLATYDRDSGMMDFKSASAALRFFHLAFLHLNDTSPDT